MQPLNTTAPVVQSDVPSLNMGNITRPSLAALA